LERSNRPGCGRTTTARIGAEEQGRGGGGGERMKRRGRTAQGLGGTEQKLGATPFCGPHVPSSADPLVIDASNPRPSGELSMSKKMLILKKMKIM